MTELEQVKAEFPGLNATTILTAFAQGMGNSLHDVAEALDDYEHQVEQRGVARFLKENPASKQNLPPGWPKASAAQRQLTTAQETAKPKNVKEASAAALKYLQALGQ